jgi:hypothetical protein
MLLVYGLLCMWVWKLKIFFGLEVFVAPCVVPNSFLGGIPNLSPCFC